LPAYLDHELSQGEVTELERHVDVCVFCSTELAALRATSRMLDAWEDIPPRRWHMDRVINQIRAEEQGVTENRGIGVRGLPRWSVSTAIRSAAFVVVVAGFALFSDRVPIQGTADEVPLDRVNSPEPAKALIAIDNYIRPSEYGLVLRGEDNRGPFIPTSSGGLRTRHAEDGHLFFEGRGLGEVNHIYFPGEGMAVESLIPLELR